MKVLLCSAFHGLDSAFGSAGSPKLDPIKAPPLPQGSFRGGWSVLLYMVYLPLLTSRMDVVQDLSVHMDGTLKMNP